MPTVVANIWAKEALPSRGCSMGSRRHFIPRSDGITKQILRTKKVAE